MSADNLGLIYRWKMKNKMAIATESHHAVHFYIISDFHILQIVR